MEDLTNKKCVACEGDTPPLTKAEAEKYLTQVSDKWHLEDSPPHQTGDSKTTNGNKIPRSGVGARSIWAEFKFKDFKENMAFVNKIAEIAESEGHHPDLKIYYSKLRVDLSTHAINGLSENDFILAAKIDKINS